MHVPPESLHFIKRSYTVKYPWPPLVWYIHTSTFVTLGEERPPIRDQEPHYSVTAKSHIPVLPQRATSYTWAHMNITPSLPHSNTYLCSARFIVNTTDQHDNDKTLQASCCYACCLVGLLLITEETHETGQRAACSSRAAGLASHPCTLGLQCVCHVFFGLQQTLKIQVLPLPMTGRWQSFSICVIASTSCLCLNVGTLWKVKRIVSIAWDEDICQGNVKVIKDGQLVISHIIARCTMPPPQSLAAKKQQVT